MLSGLDSTLFFQRDHRDHIPFLPNISTHLASTTIYLSACSTDHLNMPARRPSCKPAPAHPRVSHNDWDNSLDDNNDSGMEMSGGGSGGGSEIGEIEESLKRTMAVDVSLPLSHVRELAGRVRGCVGD